MEKIKPTSLNWPRVYYTGFDHEIVTANRGHLEILKKKVERDLKLLLLHKTDIVCAASHLSTNFVYDFFHENRLLLTNGAILPALRTDHATIGDALSNSHFRKKVDAIQFYNDSIEKYVSWDLQPNTTWFRDNFLEELKNPNSVLQLNLKGNTNLDQLKELIEQQQGLSRDTIDIFLKSIQNKDDRKLISNFRDLLYHISGSRVVMCESSLPQENYIDYDLADINHKRTKLSENNIFTKLFIELFYVSIFGVQYSTNFIDNLSFYDIFEMRKVILNSSFQQIYNNFVNTQIIGYNSQILNINQLNSIFENLKNNFVAVFTTEFLHFMKKKQHNDDKKCMNNGFSLALGLTSLVPVIGTYASLASIAKDGTSLMVNLTNRAGIANTLEDYMKQRQKALISIIKKSELTDKSILIDFIKMLSDVINTKYKL